jgi:inorganic triphosphatase YgiF
MLYMRAFIPTANEAAEATQAAEAAAVKAAAEAAVVAAADVLKAQWSIQSKPLQYKSPFTVTQVDDSLQSSTTANAGDSHVLTHIAYTTQ